MHGGTHTIPDKANNQIYDPLQCDPLFVAVRLFLVVVGQPQRDGQQDKTYNHGDSQRLAKDNQPRKGRDQKGVGRDKRSLRQRAALDGQHHENSSRRIRQSESQGRKDQVCAPSPIPVDSHEKEHGKKGYHAAEEERARGAFGIITILSNLLECNQQRCDKEKDIIHGDIPTLILFVEQI